MIWKIAKLGDICKIQTGNSIPVKEKKVLYKNIDEVCLMLLQRMLGLMELLIMTMEFVFHQSIVLNLSYLKRIQYLFVERAEVLEEKLHFLIKTVTVNKLFSICSVTETVPKYVYYYALSNEFQNQFKNAMNGLIEGVSLSKIRIFKLPIHQSQNNSAS